MQHEPISPELVLVDPELARRERAKLEERAQLRAIHEAEDLRRAVERTLEVSPAPAPVVRRPLAAASGRSALAVALFCSLLANGFFVAKLVTRSHGVATTAAAVVPSSLVTTTGVATTAAAVVPSSFVTSTDQDTTAAQTIQQAQPPAKHVTAPERATPTTAAAVEQKLLSLIISASPRKLPKAFVDPTTGLVRNNVSVACRLSARRTFLCAIRPPTTSSPRAQLLVRYRVGVDGKGVFHWFR